MIRHNDLSKRIISPQDNVTSVLTFEKKPFLFQSPDTLSA
jgi:hypothetical protein